MEHARQGEDVGARIDRPDTSAHSLFRTHILWCADRDAGPRQSLLGRLGHRARDPEIGDHRVALFEQDVLGLDVAMNHAAAVRRLEPIGDLAGDAQRFIER